MKKYLLALENGYMKNSDEMIYQKGKKYPVIDELNDCVLIIDEMFQEHWFDETPHDNTYKIIIKTKESTKRQTDNWKKTISKSKWLRCVEDENCFVIDSLVGIYYNPATGFIYRIIKNCNNKKIYVSINLRKVGMLKDSGVAEYYDKLVEDYYDKVIKADAMNSCHSKGGDSELFEELKESLEQAVEIKKEREKSLVKSEWTDKHYDFNYKLTEKDLENGYVRVDAYFVNRMWKINSWDDTGAAFHNLKTFTRIANEKNDLERELTALYKQVKCLCKLHGVEVE